ncbi:MAG TPA: FtsX-like permease family protein, partial [Kofleriaceae bacterium]|nr:FtsX-like permease family protein [Kofleriaceae bacterium]
CTEPVPAVLSPFLLELYNGAIAPSHGLPRVGRFLAGRFRGFTFTAELGASFFGNRAASAPPRECRFMLVGIARHAAPLAVTVPLAFVQRWNAEYAGANAAKHYSSVLLELHPRADLGRLAAYVRELGYTVADSGAERIGLALTLLTLLFALVSFAIVAVAAINIAHTFFRAVAERRREIGVLRALGASAADVQRLFLAEAAAIGLLGAVAGLLVARLGALALDAASRRWVPDFPFKPDSYFAFGWQIIAGAIVCSILACMAGALLPARAAARLDPSEALAAP